MCLSPPSTVLPEETIISDEMSSPMHNTSSIPYPLILSPSPTPISSPTLFTPTTPSSAGSRANIDKWKEIVRKLSYHNELRSVWNQLKISGGFLTNVQFIGHLLHHEAARQDIHFDILSVNELSNGSEETQLDQYQSDNELSPACSIHPSDTESTPSKYTVGREQHKKEGEAQGTQTSTSISDESNGGSDFVLTVLDSQMQCTPDESGT